MPLAGGVRLRGEAVAWVLDGYTDDWVVEGLLSPAELGTKAESWAADGYRPLSVSSRDVDGQVEYAAIFVRDRIDPATTRMFLGVGEDDLAALAEGLDQQVPYSIASRDGRDVFDVLTAAPESQQQAIMAADLTEAEFRTQDADLRRSGYHLVTAVPYVGAGGGRWVGVWQRYGGVYRARREPDAPWGVWGPIEQRAVATVMGGGVTARAN